MNDELASTSMQIIIHAGDGRTATYKAITAMTEGDFAAAKQRLVEADTALQASHRLHTDRIQAEAGGEESEYSMLFAHAQDTLMTAYSEFRLVKRLTPVFEGFETRIAKLEENR